MRSVIHHCGAITHTGPERQALERANIQATGEVLELATASGRPKQSVFWSTALVSGSREGVALEDQLTPPPHFRSIAEETMFRAEKVIREAMSHVPVTILRPSLLVGDSKSGEIDYLDGPYLLIQFMLNSPPDMPIPLPKRGEVPLNVAPVDYAIDAGLTIASDARSVERTFHIVDPAPLTVRRIIELIAKTIERPCEITDLPAGLTTALLRAPGVRRWSEIPRALLELTATEVAYDTSNTGELLEGAELQCPPLSSYLAHV